MFDGLLASMRAKATLSDAERPDVVDGQAVRTVAALPGVDGVALAGLVPHDGSNSQVTIRLAESGRPISTSPDINVVGPGYFALLDIPVRTGREFQAGDRHSEANNDRLSTRKSSVYC